MLRVSEHTLFSDPRFFSVSSVSPWFFSVLGDFRRLKSDENTKSDLVFVLGVRNVYNEGEFHARPVSFAF